MQSRSRDTDLENNVGMSRGKRVGGIGRLGLIYICVCVYIYIYILYI